MNPAQRLAVAALLTLAPPASAARVSLLVEGAARSKSGARLAGPAVKILDFDRARLADPIVKGRFLGAVQWSEFVFAAAEGSACGWLAREAEGVVVHCVTPYSGSQVLDYARGARWRRIALVSSPGYERVIARLRAAGRLRGLDLAAVLIARGRDLPERLPKALASVDAVWLLGDKALSEGPPFEYLVEQSLARRIPLIAPGVELVAQGAFLGAESDDDAVFRHAAGLAAAAAAGERVETMLESPPGELRVNEVLARRWRLRVPAGTR